MSEDRFMKGQLISGIGSLYTVEGENGEVYPLRCKRKFRHMHVSPLVGDNILFTPGTEDENGWIEEILPRKTQCIRPPVANVEMMVIVIAPVPEPDLLLVDRLMVQAQQQGMERMLVVNKCDLDSPFGEKIRSQYRNADIFVAEVSGEKGDGVEQLRRILLYSGKLCCLTGQSGVGKSTLLNSLLNLELETGEISRKIQRGKNTTRSTSLIRRNGISILDTAGFSLLEFQEIMEPSMLKEYYPEFGEYEGQCRFSTCLHNGEKGCAVMQAVENGSVPRERYERYRLLLSEACEKWRQRYD